MTSHSFCKFDSKFESNVSLIFILHYHFDSWSHEQYISYLSNCLQLGPVFTLKVAGKRLTFLTEPEDFKYFFDSNTVDFQKAVQKPVEKTGKGIDDCNDGGSVIAFVCLEVAVLTMNI